jgi:two-component sensor histidine kinase
MTSSSPQGVDMHEVLLIELHHRFYNSLQVISSLASRLTRGEMSSDMSRAAASQLQDRIFVLGKLHRLLAQPHGNNLKRSCEQLCRTLASAYDRDDVNLRLSLPTDPMSAGMCRGLMLMLAELVTNALKHAPLEVPLDLDVALTSSDLGYDLAVRSPGQADDVGLTVPPRVASQLAARFGGVLTVDTREGYRVHVTIPAN